MFQTGTCVPGGGAPDGVAPRDRPAQIGLKGVGRLAAARRKRAAKRGAKGGKRTVIPTVNARQTV